MNITARGEYAVRALLTLAAEAADEGGDGLAGATPVPVDRLARVQRLPRKFLESILADLKRAGLVTSRRGVSGGYLLARPDTEVTVGDVIRAVDGPLAEVRGQRPHETEYHGDAEHLPTLWVAARAALRHVLDGTSLAQLRTGDLPEAVRRLATEPDAWESR